MTHLSAPARRLRDVCAGYSSGVVVDVLNRGLADAMPVEEERVALAACSAIG